MIFNIFLYAYKKMESVEHTECAERVERTESVESKTNDYIYNDIKPTSAHRRERQPKRWKEFQLNIGDDIAHSLHIHRRRQRSPGRRGGNTNRLNSWHTPVQRILQKREEKDIKDIIVKLK
jgi:hypothetical protein